MSKLIKHHINEVMDMHCLTKGKMGYSVVYYANDVDKVIAELKNQYKDMDVTHTVHIAKMNARIEDLEEAQRWRKFSEEKPKEKQWILVFVENPSKYGTYTELRRWDMGCKFDVENQELYTKWMPLPSAPKEEK